MYLPERLFFANYLVHEQKSTEIPLQLSNQKVKLLDKHSHYRTKKKIRQY